MVLGQGKEAKLSSVKSGTAAALTRFSPVNCKAFITRDLVLYYLEKKENIPLRAKI